MMVYEEVEIHALYLNHFLQMDLQTAVHCGPTIAPSESLEASDRDCSCGQDSKFNTNICAQACTIHKPFVGYSTLCDW